MTRQAAIVNMWNLISSPDSINIGGWKFEDENGSTNKLIETSFIIPPQQYFISIADSSALITYNLFDFENKNIIGESNLGLVNTG